MTSSLFHMHHLRIRTFSHIPITPLSHLKKLTILPQVLLKRVVFLFYISFWTKNPINVHTLNLIAVSSSIFGYNRLPHLQHIDLFNTVNVIHFLMRPDQLSFMCPTFWIGWFVSLWSLTFSLFPCILSKLEATSKSLNTVRFSTYIIGIYTVNAVSYKLHRIRRHVVAGCFTNDTNFVYLGVSADSYLSYFKVHIFPLTIGRTLWADTLVLCKYTYKYSHILSPNEISSHWESSSKPIISWRNCLLVFYYYCT